MSKQQLSTNTFTTAKWIVSANASDGTHTTIGAALSAASSGDTIFIRPGTYTENPTLVAGVNLSAFDCDGLTPNVTINGTCTATFAGTCSLSGICLQTNSNYSLSVTGSSATIVDLINCFISAYNNDAIDYTSSSSSSGINLYFCNGDIPGSGNNYLTASGSGTINIVGGLYTNSSSSTTANTISAGALALKNVEIDNPLTTSGTSSINLLNAKLAGVNTTALTVGGSGASACSSSHFSSGTASGVSISSTLLMSECIVNSSNTNAITGTGTLEVGEISFIGSSSTINSTLTVTSLVSSIGSLNLNTALTAANGGTGKNTYSNTNALLCTGTTSTGAFQTITSVNSGQVLTSAGDSTKPAWSGYPQISGLGIGISPGATAGITFDGTSYLDNFAQGTFSPTILGATTAGTTTYTTQTGRYQRVGNNVFIEIYVLWTAATGTGIIEVGALPFTVNSALSYYPASIYTNIAIATATSYLPIFLGGSTSIGIYGLIAATGALVNSSLAANTSNFVYICGTYEI